MFYGDDMKTLYVLPVLLAFLVGCQSEIQIRHTSKEVEQFGYNSAKSGFEISDNPYDKNPEMADWMRGFVKYMNEHDRDDDNVRPSPRPAPHRCTCGPGCKCCKGCACGGRNSGDSAPEIKSEEPK